MSNRIVVLGGNGFIGSNLVESLARLGHAVVVYDRSEALFAPRLPDVEYVFGELGNAGMIADVLREGDIVYHLVSTTLPATSNEDPGFDVVSNVAATVNVLEECVKARIDRVVFSSSGGTIYGVPETLPISEDHPTNPVCSYGISKLAIEKYLALFRHLHGLEYVVLRPSNPFGRYQNPRALQGAISVFMHRLLRQEKINIWGDGSVVRDYIYIDDLVEALVLAATGRRAVDQVFNIGSGQGLSLNALVKHLEEATGITAQVDYSLGRSLDSPKVVLDIRKAADLLNWKPATEMQNALKGTYEWLAR